MKKHKIEDIFSSMEDFSSVPPPELWSQIEEKLDKPKKKKRVVLWWSAAACLLLGLLLPSILHFTSSPVNKDLNGGDFGNGNNSVVLDGNNKDNPKNQNPKNNENVTTTTLSDSLNKNSQTKNQFDAVKGIQNQETSVANTNSVNKSSKKNSESNVQIPANFPNQSIAFENNASAGNKEAAKSSKKSILENNKKSSNKGISEERIAFGKQNKFNSTTNKPVSNSVFNENLVPKTEQNIAFNNSGVGINNTLPQQNKPKNAFESTSTELTFRGNSKNKNLAENNSAELAFKNTKDNSKFNNNALTKIDSAQLAELQNLEKGILPSDEKKDNKEKKGKSVILKERWAVAVFAGVASSENTKNEKTLGNVNDSRQSNSYGVKTKYNINNKWAVSSGLKLNELGQSVANISYVSAKNNALIVPGLSPSDNTAAAASSFGNSEYVLVSSSTKEAMKNDNVQNGKLDQNLRYVEMPLEVSYSIFNKNKASINLNTGGFVGKLISNNVAIDGHSLGQNANANDYVYGSTLSSTVQYRVYKKTNVFVEPAMNYYINPLNNQSFNQFQWGLNFGLNVSF